VTIQGLWLGLVLFTLAFIVILFYYLGRIRRVNRLIEDEYSLEKALEQLEKEEKENAENDNNQDEK
jgi:K+ transporter